MNVCRRIRHGRVAKTRVETALEAHRAEMGRQVFKTYFSLNLNVSDAWRFLNVVFVSKTSGAEFYESRLCLILRKASFESRLRILVFFELKCEQNL